ncbi:DIGIT [Trypanosoma equiperdum]|uniref:Uncharacterized protein n=2 Tax=Trypanozoon TaxID=39700 RepID=Q57UW5_TRYB2|nr:hypothetical protein, conserved [Trypanosoma brucei brucei TREU927]AAX70599.1 hypothetical protein, conserved [Trypanosoma brucei]AAZ13251.1 hypothetical protein, conserved [Trypanosoma brucei brucei TREU927]SCU69040.1 DIGIT [Trypanosoma equiperdum]
MPAPHNSPRLLECRHVFGVCESVKGGIQYLDDNNVVWVSGKNLIILDTQLGTQQMVSCTPGCKKVTAMALSNNRRFLAVAESSKQPSIVIYGCDSNTTPRLKRKKILQLPDLGSSEYVSLSFSHDGRNLASLGGQPEWNLVYWSVERGKVIASCAVLDDSEAATADHDLLKQCSICPNDSSIVCVSGSGIVRFFSQQGSQLRRTPGGVRESVTNYLAHVWIPSENWLILSTENGDLVLMENNEVKYALPLSPSDGIAITALVACGKGFICGGDLGLISIYERVDNKEMYRKVRTFKFNNDSNIMGPPGDAIPVILSFTLSPPPAEEYVSFLTSTKQLYSLNLPNADFFKNEDGVFEPIGQPFHSAPVIGVDICVQRPLAVTAGRDRCVFVWNFITGVVEFRKRFTSDICSVALHPSGTHLLVGLADGLHMMNLYYNDVRHLKNIGIRSCMECRFSNGGNFFAAAHATTVYVYFTHTCELIGHLRGHSGKVKSIYFVPPDDTRIITVGMDGAVFEFSLCDFHKVNDNTLKEMTYNCAVADLGTVWTAGNDRKLRQFDRTKLSQVAVHDLHNASIFSMAISSRLKLLFTGCEDGTVRVFNTYLGERLSLNDNDNDVNGIMSELHHAHAGVVSRLVLSFDDGLIISTGEDGAVIFWDVVAPYRGPQKEVEYSSELFVARKDMEASTKTVVELTAEATELKERMRQQQIIRDRVHEEQLSRLEREFAEKRAERVARFEALKEEKNEQAIRFTEYMAEMEDKDKASLLRTKEDYAAKILFLRRRSDRLQQLISEKQHEHDKNIVRIREQARQKPVEDREIQQRTIKELDDRYQQLLAEKEEDEKRTDTFCAMMEEATDVEVIKRKEGNEKRRKEQSHELFALQGVNDSLLSAENIARAELEATKAEVRERMRQQAALESQIEAAKRDIEALTQEFRDRGETIAEKERRVLDLKKKNQELEKFKFVLEYKIKELKSQIDPRDEEIRQTKSRLAEMGREADKYTRSNDHLVLQIRNLRQKKAGQSRELEKLAVSMRSFGEFQSRLWTELCDLHDETNPRKLKESAKQLFDKYTSGKAIGTLKALASRSAADEVREYNRERDHLERNLAGLRNKVNKNAENNRSDKYRITAENVILIKEINDLRKEARLLAGKAGVWRSAGQSSVSACEEDVIREIASQRAELARLNEIAKKLEEDIQTRSAQVPLSTKKEE